jgi:capsular exopolysaccharide synthesis family protein
MIEPTVDERGPVETALIKPGEIIRAPSSPMVVQLGSGGEGGQGAFSITILWQALLQRLKVAAPLGLVLAAVSCAVLWYVTEPKYRSQATLQIKETRPFLAFQPDVTKGFPETQVEILRSAFIIGRANENERLASALPELREIAGKEDTIRWIAQRLRVARISQSDLYDVSFTTRYPESARSVVAAIVKTYMEYHAADSDLNRHRMLDLLSNEQVVRDTDIELKREKLRVLAKQAGGDDAVVTNPQGTSQGRRFTTMASLQQKLVDAEVEIEMVKARVEALRAEEEAADGGVTEAQLEAAMEKDTRLIKLNHDLQMREQTLQTFAPDAKRRQGVQAEIKKIESDLAARKEELKPKIVKSIAEQLARGRESALALARSQLANHEKTAETLKKKINAERGEQVGHGDKSLELEFARDELDNAEEVRRRIAERYVQLKIESRAPGQVIPVQPAQLPEFPEGPTLGKKLAMVGTGAFFAPFLLLIGWNVMHRRVFEREQLEREFDVKVVNEVAALPVRSLVPRPGAERAYQLQSHLFEESVNSLRTTLAVDERLQDARVFVVASAVSGEGKTNLSSQLAMSWSHAVQGKVIIVDADLRAPNIHELFEVKPGPGLAEVLRGECALEDAVVMDWGDRLFVLPAGDAGATSPSHLFAGPRFRQTLARLRSQYDKIIIDVPPVLCASETLLIAKAADGVLMCALHDYSRSGQVKQAYMKLTGAGVNLVGAVLNGAPVRKYSYSYRGYTPG